MLRRDNAALVFVDVQGKLAESMCDKEALFDNLNRIVEGARILGLPILWTEQLPDKLGPTLPRFTESLTGNSPITKSAFSCCGEEAFQSALRACGRKQVILAGIEAHVCICQTALDLLEQGHEVFVVADAVSSRLAANRDTALSRLRSKGAEIVSTEMALFELLREARNDDFKALLRLVK
jgi:nicotinamidase-related amidase